ncbi:MAG: glycosyl hydrolase [Cumulibacter sp.]
MRPSISRRAVLAGAAGLALAACGGSPQHTTPESSSRTAAPSSSPSPSPTTTKPPPPGPLAGVGTWIQAPNASKSLADSHARWCYTWAPGHEGIDIPQGCEFVPMFEDLSQLTEEGLALAKANGETLLGFNEPDQEAHANMSVQEALTAWPQLESTGMRLGAPAVAGNADNPASWFTGFMDGAKAKGYRVDFIPLHWYLAVELLPSYSAAVATQDLKAYLERVHTKYQMPIWLTEFSLISWYPASAAAKPSKVQAEFLKTAADMLASLPYVERWAWFSLTPPPYAPNVALYDNNGSVSAAGEQFRALA